MQKSSYLQAIDAFRRAIDLAPEAATFYASRAGAYDWLARHLRRQGEDADDAVVRALADYDAALERNPRLWIAHVNKGMLYVELGRLSEALPLYETAYQIVGDGYPPLRVWIENLRGLLGKRSRF